MSNSEDDKPDPSDETTSDDPFDDDELFDLVDRDSDATDEGEAEEAASEEDAAGALADDAEPEDEMPESESAEADDRTDAPSEEEADVETASDDTEATDAAADEAATDGASDEDASDESAPRDSADEEPDELETDAAAGGAGTDGTVAGTGDSGGEPTGEAATDDSGNDERGAPILRVEGLKTYFYTKEGEVPAVDGVDFEIGKGETLGLVGESGSGKSVSALSILRLVPDPPGKIVDGDIWFEDRNLTEVSDKEIQQIRGNEISMIFQEPMTSLNPVYTVGNQIVEAITLHQDVDYAEAREIAIGMLEKVGIPAPRERIDEYPHQMSGGMKQRVMIAMALACNPKLLIADEPTTALDVTIQAQILDLLQELQDEFDMSVLFITHDLGVIAETCDYVAVMYGGRVVEYGDVDTIFENPSHPYTIGLFSSLPQIDVDHRRRKDRLYVIPGMVPSPQDFPSGCRFRDRCDYATEECAELPPNREMEEPNHRSLCWYADEVREGRKEKTGPYPEGGSENVEAAE